MPTVRIVAKDDAGVTYQVLARGAADWTLNTAQREAKERIDGLLWLLGVDMGHDD